MNGMANKFELRTGQELHVQTDMEKVTLETDVFVGVTRVEGFRVAQMVDPSAPEGSIAEVRIAAWLGTLEPQVLVNLASYLTKLASDLQVMELEDGLASDQNM